MKKIGIIGCGKIAQVRHIPELQTNPDAQIVGYYNPTRSRAEEMAARIGYDSFVCIEVEDRAFEGTRQKILDSIKLSKRYMDQYVI